MKLGPSPSWVKPGRSTPTVSCGQSSAPWISLRILSGRTWPPVDLTGESAPENKTFGERLRRLDRMTGRCVARALGGGPEDWPVVVTRLPATHRERLDRLHERSDWVVTIDRNAGLEYFDAPRERPDVFDRFVIDAVPERDDLAALQLVTSTTNLDAVRDLVDEALAAMGLSSSERNSRFWSVS